PGPFAATAAEGRVRLGAEMESPETAAAIYRRFRERHAADAELLATVRERLGELALRLGGMPEFRAVTLDGAIVDREALRGKVLVVDFWATWCQPCLEQVPTLRRIHERFGDRVELVGVNLDHAEQTSAEELRGWLARQQLPGRQLRDGRGWDSELVRAFGVREIPFTVVADAGGRVLAVGEQGKGLERAVQAALKVGP
ncbi:MAG TPA: TlpA disulfide reductase family protein, partial [Candidatus Polarisedimenticolaceae bacterium]|nr:TlpA disulfide reductase family protein [Candidatus Polarisedimenticolaceae bacterium]